MAWDLHSAPFKAGRLMSAQSRRPRGGSHSHHNRWVGTQLETAHSGEWDSVQYVLNYFVWRSHHPLRSDLIWDCGWFLECVWLAISCTDLFCHVVKAGDIKMLTIPSQTNRFSRVSLVCYGLGFHDLTCHFLNKQIEPIWVAFDTDCNHGHYWFEKKC